MFLSFTNMKSNDELLPKGSRERLYYESHIVLTQARAIALELETRGQAHDSLWFAERQKRITASIAKQVAVRRKETRPKKPVSVITHRHSFSSIATVYGVEKKRVAREMYLKVMRFSKPSLSVSQTGLLISTDHPWLGATPGGLISDPVATAVEEGLLEIKCPFSCSDSSFSECAKKSSFCLTKDRKLKKKHPYYYQVHVQMFVAGKSWCNFCVCSPTKLHIERIHVNTAFLKEILPMIQVFYCKQVLPHLAK